MVGIRAITALVGLTTFGLVGVASADPVPMTIAQVTDSNTANDLTWTNSGTYSTLNTTNTAGDLVNFQFENIAGLSSALTGSLSAIEQINYGAGAISTVAAVGTVLPSQVINSAMTISYTLANPIGGLSNLLTITITPNSAGSGGATIFGLAGGSTGSLVSSYPPGTTYTESFTSDFLDFAINDPIAASYGLSALNPMMEIGADGMLNSFTADAAGTFSSALAPLAVPEPASFAVLAMGLIGIGFATRRRGFSAV